MSIDEILEHLRKALEDPTVRVSWTIERGWKSDEERIAALVAKEAQ